MNISAGNSRSGARSFPTLPRWGDRSRDRSDDMAADEEPRQRSEEAKPYLIFSQEQLFDDDIVGQKQDLSYSGE